jgi:hypothetical protein
MTIVSRCQGGPTHPSSAELPLRNDELLPQHRVLRQERSTRPEEIGEEAADEPEEVDHGLVVVGFPRRMAIVAMTIRGHAALLT